MENDAGILVGLHLIRVDSILRKTLMLGGIKKGGRRMGMTKDEMNGWHH